MCAGIGNINAQEMKIIRIEWRFRNNRKPALSAAIRNFAPTIKWLVIFKRAVLDQLGVKSAVAGVIDVLKNNPCKVAGMT